VAFVHDLLPNNMDKDYLSLVLNDKFYELVAEQTNKCASYCQEDRHDSKWEGCEC
jgi:hypothetical protein